MYIAVTVITALTGTTLAAQPDPLEFFEKQIRPVLVEHCYQCHNSLGTKKGGLALDYRDALLAGGDSGQVIVAGKPAESILIWALRHENGYEMPSKAPKLPPQVIRDFEQWISLGALDTRLKKPSADELGSSLPWAHVRDERKQWWSFQPLRDYAIPEIPDEQWAESPIDRFVYDRMTRAGLSPQPEAPPEVLVRRVHLILTGLPPRPEVVNAFVADPSPQAYAELVDTLLRSKAFGERWARHWMDWYRYAETHGSEGDPPIPYAPQYRDYLIRALNADVPYDHLLREHLAGDLLTHPRINEELELNESAIGPAHLRMVPHGFGVTDAYGEQIVFTDNQIDVISKAMLGITVSCARCHDHKFDPISQRDFYRLYGVMVSSRPSTVLIDKQEKLDTNKAEINAIKSKLRRAIADYWLTAVGGLGAWLDSSLFEQQNRHTHPLGTWVLLKDSTAESIPQRIKEFLSDARRIQEANEKAISEAAFYVDLRDPANADRWFSSGNGTASVVSPAGSFAVHGEGPLAIRGIYPRGIYSHLISDKHAGVFSSCNFEVRGSATHVRVAGIDAQLRAPVRNYPLIQGLHPANTVQSEQLQWMPTQAKWKYWSGERVHYELSTAADRLPKPDNKVRSWFGITELFAGDQPPQASGASLVSLVSDPTSIIDRRSMLHAYMDTLRHVVTAWRDGDLTDAEAEFLDAFVRTGFLENRLDHLPDAIRQMVTQFRELENSIPVPRRAPGVLDAEAIDQPLLVRGNPKQESEPVERGFLEIFSDRLYGKAARLQLADDMVSSANTLKTRVLINRLWAYVFGRGIVASTDNLGRLGSEPTHPGLLDYLALDFERNGWSMKHALRQMVSSRTFRSSSQAPVETRERDAQNLFLSYFMPRRLDAEAIYDSIGFLEGGSERAVYGPVIRNQLDPFLSTFNAPVPTSTVSFRTNTNVPAQSLAMMNGDRVERAARSWSDRIVQDKSLVTVEEKVRAMVLEAFGRVPDAEETALLVSYLNRGFSGEARVHELSAETRQLQAELAQAKKRQNTLLAPIRQQLQRDVDRRNAKAIGNTRIEAEVEPISMWEFDADARDSIGVLHGTIRGDARVESGALVLNGGFVVTAPINRPLRAKTLEVLVQLDRIEQSGGGVMTVQTLDGHTFDSVVFAELRTARWLAGSNHFQRTLPLDGMPENEALARPVRISIVYDLDGTIRTYRDGNPYAPPYRKSEIQVFASGDAQVTFGLRHGTEPTAGRMLIGRIFEARLFDRALSEQEIAAAAHGVRREIVTRSMLLEALTEDQRQVLFEHESAIARLEEESARALRQVRELEESRRGLNQGFMGIAHTLLNAKEFLYVH